MFQLFSTLGCHLCEDAKKVINPLMIKYRLSYCEEEIADSDVWMKAYALKIPVLKSNKTQTELDWPFDAAACEAWLVGQLDA